MKKEQQRLYAPLSVDPDEGMTWKELNMAIAKAMQNYCGGVKCDALLMEGLDLLTTFEKEMVPKLSCQNPHELMRAHEVLDILTVAKMVLYASLARKSSSAPLCFTRSDYPEMDPEKDRHHIAIHQENGEVKVRNVPLNFFGELKTEYEKRNQDYIEELKNRNEVLEKDAEKVLENGLRKLSAKGWEGAGYEKAKALAEDTTAPAEGTAPAAFELEETPLQRPSHRLPSGQMHRLQPLCLRLPVRRPLSLPGKRKTSGSHVPRRVLLLRSLRHGLPERRHRGWFTR